MGYNLIIGEAIIEKYPEDEFGDGYVEITVEGARQDDAPAFDDPTDYTNERWPSYTAWHEFAEAVGIEDILFDTDSNGSIRGGHPGHFLITDKFKSEIDSAVDRHMMKYPDAVPTYDSERPQDYQLPRLLWIQYWTDWALENCTNPIFKNS